jgi:hypothetical protein
MAECIECGIELDKSGSFGLGVSTENGSVCSESCKQKSGGE